MLQFLTAIIVTGVPNLVKPTLLCAYYKKICISVCDLLVWLENNWSSNCKETAHITNWTLLLINCMARTGHDMCMVLSEDSRKSLVLIINTFCYSFTWVLSLKKITHLFNTCAYVHTCIHTHFYMAISSTETAGRKLFIFKTLNLVIEHFTGKYQQQILCAKYDQLGGWTVCKINSCCLSIWNKGYLMYSGSEL